MFSSSAGEAIGSGAVEAGLFRDEDDDSAVVVIGVHPFDTNRLNLAELAKLDQALATETPCETIDTTLIRPFDWLPRIETRFTDDQRRYQLRIYEHPHSAAGVTKAEMFETEELAIFRRVGLNPVFFGQAVVGPNLPNLTYMLGFDDADARRNAWRTFITDPAWKALSSIPRFSDDLLIRRITNLNLAPLPGSAL